MKTLRMTILSLSAMVLILSPMQSLAATRDSRVRVRVRTPHISQKQQCESTHSWSLKKDRRFRHLSKRDRKMARRLAEYSGFSSYKFMMLRDRGFRWSEIAYRLDLPRQVVRAARNAKSWKRFVRRAHWCGPRSH